MTDTPDTSVTITDLSVENSLLRGSLWLTARALQNYHDAGHAKTDNPELRQLKVPASYREKAADALARADAMLRDERNRS
jgi:hypothetical protein